MNRSPIDGLLEEIGHRPGRPFRVWHRILPETQGVALGQRTEHPLPPKGRPIDPTPLVGERLSVGMMRSHGARTARNKIGADPKKTSPRKSMARKGSRSLRVPVTRSRCHTFRTGSPYRASSLSAVIKVIPSTSACASRMRSNGSPWIAGRTSTLTACWLVTGSSS